MLEQFYYDKEFPLTRAFGVEYPEYFLSPAAEYDALVGSCGVIDLTHRRVLRVRGGARAGFLDAMLTNDVASLQAGQGCRSLVTTSEGRIVSELFVFAREAEHLVVVSQGDFENTLAVLKGEIAGEDATIDDVSSGYGILGVEGPEAARVIHRLLGTGSLPASALGSVEREFETFNVLVMQGSATGENGLHTMVPAAEVLRIRDYLVQAARGSDGLPVGLAAWNIRRVEEGLPWYGVDFAGEDIPDEVLLGDAVCFAKTSFRGKEALAPLRGESRAARTLVGLVAVDHGSGRTTRDDSAGEPDVAGEVDLRDLFPRGSPIYRLGGAAGAFGESPPESEPAGFVTSAVYSPALRAPLLMGRAGHEQPGRAGNTFAVRTPRGMLPLRRIELPISR